MAGTIEEIQDGASGTTETPIGDVTPVTTTIEEIQDGASGTTETPIGDVTPVTTTIGEAGVVSVGELSDVDLVTEGKIDGSVLVYNLATDKWTSTLKLEKQLMNGGFF